MEAEVDSMVVMMEVMTGAQALSHQEVEEVAVVEASEATTEETTGDQEHHLAVEEAVVDSTTVVMAGEVMLHQ